MGIRPLDTLLYVYMKLLKAVDTRQTSVDDLPATGIRNVLIVSSTAIGDTLLSTPAIRAIRKRYPRAYIVALFNKANMELFANNPCINKSVPYYGGYKRFFATARALKAAKPDIAFILHGNEPQATPLCYLSGARFIFKLPNNSRFNFLLSNHTPVVEWKEVVHGINVRLKCAALAGCPFNDVRMELFVAQADTDAANGFLLANGLDKDDIAVGFQPGASTVSRQWFADRFIALGRRLVASRPKVRIILTGSNTEAALCEQIASGIGDNAINTAGRLPLKQLPTIIRRLACLITGDTGPMHIAITAGTPVVGLYAVSDPSRTGPLYDKERHIIIQKPRTCEPCVSKRCKYQRCMEAITVDEVEAAVRAIVGRAQKR